MVRSKSAYALAAGSVLMGGLLFVSSTYAGKKVDEQVAVNLNVQNRYASGSPATARSSADGLQQIGCSLTEAGTVTCFARNAANLSLSCTSTSSAARDFIAAMNSDSRIYFQADGNGRCIAFIVDNSSVYAPKVP